MAMALSSSVVAADDVLITYTSDGVDHDQVVPFDTLVPLYYPGWITTFQTTNDCLLNVFPLDKSIYVSPGAHAYNPGFDARDIECTILPP
ncbi:hypothetical protein BO83DRAFT_429417 [Aspergillus eucalypticola CBS 122712]|uniref:Uncharacterized protein n=1 Tax=Aspergillus eucalypticola (strain CBS 122712 / IBT 29274) TaxID=1448314 RepID=A0A317V410_ASPEC|nr:uncharacterized protein BO83DRAFT_429417 [Aspergillus eucalypticola CBS 122712]PWY67798.1 hypothetical protein BO83DRAFT_429417 [Aspergillus eucalypticola CBS 122712]